MHIESVNIEVQILDSAGVPTSAPLLYGVVRNNNGKIVDNLSLEDLTEVTTGVYQLLAYDVTDTQRFPGTEFTIFWCTQSIATSPETALQAYVIFGEHPTGFQTRLITWCPTYREEHLYGYEIFRSLPWPSERGAVEMTGLESIGRSLYPYFFDQSDYVSSAEYHRTTFEVRELIWRADVPEEPGYGSQTSRVEIIESPYNYCKINGHVSNVSGDTSAHMLSFMVHEQDAPQKFGFSYLQRRNEVSVPINEQGYFSVPLLQGSLVTVELSDIGLMAKFVVPRQTTVAFSCLDFHPIDTHRAQ